MPLLVRSVVFFFSFYLSQPSEGNPKEGSSVSSVVPSYSPVVSKVSYTVGLVSCAGLPYCTRGVEVSDDTGRTLKLLKPLTLPAVI